MFSDVGQSLDQDTVEYAWLIEMQMGKLSGKLTTPQLYSILACLETLILLLGDQENELNSPKDDVILSQPVVKKKNTQSTQNVHVQHVQQAIQQLLQPKNNTNVQNKASQTSGQNNNQRQSNKPSLERRKDEEKKKEDEKKGSIRSNVPAEENSDVFNEHKLKYKLCRVAIDAVDFWLVESGAALQLWVSILTVYLALSCCEIIFLGVTDTFSKLQFARQTGQFRT